MDEAKKSEVRGEKQKISKEMRERLRSLFFFDYGIFFVINFQMYSLGTPKNPALHNLSHFEQVSISSIFTARKFFSKPDHFFIVPY